MGSSYSEILAFSHLISLGSSWKVKGRRKKEGSVIFVARWKQTREDRGKEKQEENSWEVCWGASNSLAAFSCPCMETKPEQNEPLSSAALGGMLDLKQSQLEFEKLVKLFYSRREKKTNTVRHSWLMINLAAFFFFLSKISLWTFYCLPQHRATLIRMKAKHSLYFISCKFWQMTNLCLEDFCFKWANYHSESIYNCLKYKWSRLKNTMNQCVFNNNK